MSTIRVKQINQPELDAFVTNAAGGSAFAAALTGYINVGGYFGPNIVYASGADQTISGQKRFDISPIVPYTGASGTAPSRRYVDDQINNVSGASNSSLFTTSGVLVARDLLISGVLAQAIATASSPNGVTTTGNETIGGFKVFTGSPFVPDATQSSGVVNLAMLLAASGALTGTAGGGGGGGTSNAVTTTGNEIIGGFKTFTGSPFVPVATQPSGTTNLSQLQSLSGILTGMLTGVGGGGVTNNFYFTGTGFITTSSNATGNIVNTFNVTSGNITNNSSGNITNNFNGAVTNNIASVTGNFVNMSFWFDQNNLSTGLNTIEAFVGRSFFFTGYSVGAINSGTQGAFSGSFYQRTQNNTKVNFVNFGMNSGLFFTGRGGFNQTISGMNRVGLDIYSIGTGLTGVSVGLFGVGY